MTGLFCPLCQLPGSVEKAVACVLHSPTLIHIVQVVNWHRLCALKTRKLHENDLETSFSYGGGYCELLAWPGIPQVEKYPSLAGAASGIIPAQDLFSLCVM